MTIGDLIKNKDYDFVSYKIMLSDDFNMFAGAFRSKNGEIITIGDDDRYDKDEEVLSYEEWSDDEIGINNGLTVVVKVSGFVHETHDSLEKGEMIIEV